MAGKRLWSTHLSPLPIPSSLATNSGPTITFLKGPGGVVLSLAAISGHCLWPHCRLFEVPRRCPAHRRPIVPHRLYFFLFLSLRFHLTCPASHSVVTYLEHIAKLCARFISHLFMCLGVPPPCSTPSTSPTPHLEQFIAYVVLFILWIWANNFQVLHRCCTRKSISGHAAAKRAH